MNNAKKIRATNKKIPIRVALSDPSLELGFFPDARDAPLETISMITRIKPKNPSNKIRAKNPPNAPPKISPKNPSEFIVQS